MASEEEKPKIITEIKSKISKDKKETTIRIPSELVSKFSIDADKDAFVWLVLGNENNEDISLRGVLVKGKHEEKNN